MKTITLEQAYAKATPGPFKSNGSLLLSKIGNFVHDRSGARFVNRMAADIDASNHADINNGEREINAALLAHCFNVLPEVVKVLESVADGNYSELRLRELAVSALVKATKVKIHQ